MIADFLDWLFPAACYASLISWALGYSDWEDVKLHSDCQTKAKACGGCWCAKFGEDGIKGAPPK